MTKANPIKKPISSNRTLILLVTLVCCMLSVTLPAQSRYVKKYRPIADSLSDEYGIPTAVILGVAILESGSGSSRNAKLLNNHFGIVGKNNLMKTKGVRSRYKQYQAPKASYSDFCRLIARKKYYSRLKGTKDYKPWLEAMSKAGYSEAPLEWKKRITATIKKNKLSTTH